MIVSPFLKVGTCCVCLLCLRAYGLGNMSGEVSVSLPAGVFEESYLRKVDISNKNFIDPEEAILKVEKPTKTPLTTQDGKFIVSTIESYSVGKKDNRTHCSFVTRNNLQALVGALGIDSSWLARGDAEELIKKGVAWGTVKAFQDTKSVLGILNERKNNFLETVFDVYRYVPTRKADIQYHRATVFLGNDDKWYILDPSDGERTINPQDFSKYLSRSPKSSEWYIRMAGYSKLTMVAPDIFSTLMMYLSPELHEYYQLQYVQVPRRFNVVEFS